MENARHLHYVPRVLFSLFQAVYTFFLLKQFTLRVKYIKIGLINFL